MAIDASIISGLRPVQFESPVNALAQMLQVQSAQQQNQLGQIRLDEHQRGVERTNRLQSLLGSLKDDDPAEQQINKLTRGGFLPEARSLAESAAKVAKEQREAEKFQLENTRQKIGLGAQILGSAKDQASYDAARATAEAAGLDVSRMPPQFDPAFVQGKLREALTAQEQLEQHWKAKGFDLQVQQFGETKRHNKATESVAAGQLGVAQARERREAAAPRGQVVQTETGPILVDPRTGASRPVLGADGQPVKSTKAPTEFQGKSAAFGARAEQADKLISELEGKYRPAAINAKNAVENTWLVGGALGAITNQLALRESDQRAEQAQRDFINAVLRQESGAAIGVSEFDNARKQYFPQPGDSSAVIKQKAANRKLAVQGLQSNAGRAAFSAPMPEATSAQPPEIESLLQKYGQ